MLLVTASGKGGVGKTTTAALLYHAAIARGLAATVVNVDPQRSLLHWLGDAVQHRPDVFDPAELVALDSPSQLTIVDTPPGTAPQALAAWQAADVMIGCSGSTTMELAGLADLASRLSSHEDIDLVAIGRFDARVNHHHAVLDAARQRWGASRVVTFPNRSEVANAYDQARPVASSSPVALAAADLLARVLDLPAAKALKEAPRG